MVWTDGRKDRRQTDAKMDGQMDIRMDGQTYGWMDIQTDGRTRKDKRQTEAKMYGWMDIHKDGRTQIDRLINGQTDRGQINAKMNGPTEGWMSDRWTDGQTRKYKMPRDAKMDGHAKG